MKNLKSLTPYSQTRLGKVIACGLGILLAPLVMGEAAPEALPLPAPTPFQMGSGVARQDPQFRVSSFPERNAQKDTQLHLQPSFTVGNKAVYLRKASGRNMEDKDENVSIYIDDKEVGRIAFWGGYPGNSGYPFAELEDYPEQLLFDEAEATVTYRKPYLTPDGQKAVFEYRLRSLGDSQIELSWDSDVDNVLAEPKAVSLWLTMDAIYRDNAIVFGETEVEVQPHEVLVIDKASEQVSGDFHFNPGSPDLSYSILLGGMSGWVTQSHLKDDRYGWIFRGESKPEGKVIIDLEEGKLPAVDTPAPVAGVDFWKIDGIHVPVSPVRNIMPNPSFEQGLRYWRWTGGGAHYTRSEGPRYEVVPDGLFGQHALWISDQQKRSAGLQSFPMNLVDGQTYTLSFYAKAVKNNALTVALASASKGGKFRGKYGIVFGDSGSQESKFNITTEWQRFSRTFVADGGGLTLIISGGDNILIDGLQIEEGDTPTDFIAAPLDGFFVTSDPTNDIHKGDAIEPALRFTGQPGTTGQVSVSLKNAYKEVLFEETVDVTIPEAGVVTVPLTLDSKVLGEGVFVIRADYKVKGYPDSTDYYRLSVMAPLTNTHATKDIFGILTKSMNRIGRGDEYGAKMRDWGFGSTSWGITLDELQNSQLAQMEKDYGIANYFNTTIPRNTDAGKVLYGYKGWTEVTPEIEAMIEEEAYTKVKQYDPEQYNTWHFGNEEESSNLPGNGKFDEYFKAQSAAARGVKRANPDALFAPTNGTSGYSRLRGYDAIEGYLKAANEHSFKYDAISVHPYWSIDKGSLSNNDLDEETARLIEQMERNGYGKETPIFFTEMFNIPETYYPAWGATLWGDSYHAGKLSYDFGNREFIHAASAARAWIMCLKYWPQLRSANFWMTSPFVDVRLSPILFSKVANTLGHHMPDVAYYADIKPAAGIRGYSFKRPDGTGIAAIWCVDYDVENGLKVGPELEVQFSQDVQFFDLMGNPRIGTADAKGVTTIPLTPAPLLIEADDVEALTQSLQDGQVNDAMSALAIAMEPSLDGQIYARVQNLTGRPQSGIIQVAGVSMDYALGPEQKEALAIPNQTTSVEFGTMYSWSHNYSVQPENGKGYEDNWSMDYFYVSKTSGMPDWNTIPAIPITNRTVSKKYTGDLPEGDQKAQFQIAWDESNLYLRVEVEDDHFVYDPEVWRRPNPGNTLWLNDGCLEVYFDTGADGRTNLERTFDVNDYRYDFSISKTGESGPGEVNRFRAVNHQLAQGLDMPTKEEANEKVTCDFQRTEKGYTYTITFAQRYLEPLMLRKGYLSGFALYIHDKDSTESIGCSKGLSMATEPGETSDYKPFYWPLMMLTE